MITGGLLSTLREPKKHNHKVVKGCFFALFIILIPGAALFYEALSHHLYEWTSLRDSRIQIVDLSGFELYITHCIIIWKLALCYS